MNPFYKLLIFSTLSCAILAMVGCADMNYGKTDGTASTTGSSSTAGSSSNDGLTAVNTGNTRVSQGTQGDSLNACLDRIPKDASNGQRQLATMTCERDAKSRMAIDAVPGK